MKKFIAATALTTLLAGQAFGAAHEMKAPFYTPDEEAMGLDMRASELIGKRLYTNEADLSAEGYTDVSDDWEDVGEISDIVVNGGGGAGAVLLDIGGFLGIGERTVAVSMDQLQFVRDGDDEDDYFVVLKANREILENAPEYGMVD